MQSEEDQEMVRKKAPFWKTDLSQPRFLPGGAKFVPWSRRLAIWISFMMFLVFLVPGIIMLVIATPPVLCVVSEALWPYSASCKAEIAIIVFASTVFCAITAHLKNRRAWLWAFLGAVIPLVPLFVLLTQSKISEEEIANG